MIMASEDDSVQQEEELKEPEIKKRKLKGRNNMLHLLNKHLGGADENQAFYLLMEDISLDSAKGVIEWILQHNFSEHRPQVLNLMICSPGGDVNAAFAIIDVMRGSSVPVRTIGLGEIASCGLMIFIAGEKGERVLTPNTSILSHQYSWGSIGKEHELFATVKAFELTSQKLVTHYKKCTGLSEKIIKEKLLPAHDVWLSADDAKELGICDKIKSLN